MLALERDGARGKAHRSRSHGRLQRHPALGIKMPLNPEEMKILSSLRLEEIVTGGPRSRGRADDSSSWWGLQAGSPRAAGWGVQTETRFHFSSQTETSQIKPLSALSSNHGDASAAFSQLGGDREELYRTGGCCCHRGWGLGAVPPCRDTEAKVQTPRGLSWLLLETPNLSLTFFALHPGTWKGVSKESCAFSAAFGQERAANRPFGRQRDAVGPSARSPLGGGFLLAVKKNPFKPGSVPAAPPGRVYCNLDVWSGAPTRDPPPKLDVMQVTLVFWESTAPSLQMPVPFSKRCHPCQ